MGAQHRTGAAADELEKPSVVSRGWFSKIFFALQKKPRVSFLRKFFVLALETDSPFPKSVRRQAPVLACRGASSLLFDPCRFSKDVAMQTENRKDFDLDRLLHPAGAFRTPMEVVNDPDMTVQEKRAILASWASDACAVEASPDLRQPPSAPVIRFDDIMDALKHLDGEAADKPTYGKFINRARRWKDLYRSDRGGRSLVA
jgi:hypothetical protein